MRIRSLWHEDAVTSIIRVEEYTIPKDTLQIKSLYSFISLGTERLISRGEVPPSLLKMMQVPYMRGSFSLPIQYGYSMVGEVQQSDHPLYGSRIHLMHPHQDFCIVNEKDVTLIPDQVPSQRAVLASNVETAINAIWDGEVSIGDRILIVGFGNIGALIALVARSIIGVEVLIAEVDDYRIAKAKCLGFQMFEASKDKFDVVFHTSGSAEGLQLAVENAGFEGKVVELSWYGTKKVMLSLGASFHHERKQIISSQVGKIPTKKSNNWDYKRRKDLVWKILEQPIFDQVLTNEIVFSESDQFFNEVRTILPKGLGFYLKY